MNTLNEIIKSRRSIRKFTDETISDEIIREIIESACYAPSACNSQCWKFVAIKDKDTIQKLSKAVADGNTRFYTNTGTDESFLKNRINQATFFRNAPLVICVFMTDMKYHDQRVTDIFAGKGMNEHDMSIVLGEPDVLTIGAAVQNMLLTIHEKGLGACWMNDPVIAADEICEMLGMTENCRLMSIIPVGVPAYAPREKVLKPIDEILKIV